MILLTDERLALSDWVESVNQNALAQALRPANVRIEMFSANTNPMPVIALALIGWLEKNSGRIRPILAEVVARFPDHESVAILKLAAERLARVEQAQGRELPWKAVLAKGVPIVNRAPLRDALERLISDSRPDVILVDGQEGTGRSHSWHLIHHVACSTSSITPLKVDLVAPTVREGSIEALFDILVRRLKLPNARKPTTTGATAETVAGRYADEIATAWAEQPRVALAWIVFDSVDRPVSTEAKHFICALAERVLHGELQGCKIFLLGASEGFGVYDPYRLSEIERLTFFQAREVEEAATIINARGAQPKDDAALQQWLSPVTCELALLGGRGAGEHISRKLVELREAVRA